jgi:gamma-glutamylcyclotransferase (GGCT)/AIG2-like uncharacterized protein YtfP
MNCLLFVYGTLRRNGPAAHLMNGAVFAAEASIVGRVIQRDGYPGLLDGDDSVSGELYEVTGELLARLDLYEGPGYARRLSQVRIGETAVQAFVYWLR